MLLYLATYVAVGILFSELALARKNPAFTTTTYVLILLLWPVFLVLSLSIILVSLLIPR